LTEAHANTATNGTTLAGGSVNCSANDLAIAIGRGGQDSGVLVASWNANTDFVECLAMESDDNPQAGSMCAYERLSRTADATLNPTITWNASQTALLSANLVVEYDATTTPVVPFIVGIAESSDTAAASKTFTVPTNSDGDELWAFIVGTQGTADPADTITDPAGWTEVFNSNISAGSACRLYVGHKTASSEPGTYDWTGGSAQFDATCTMIAVRNAANTGHDVASSFNTGTSTAPSCPTITPSVTDCLVIRFFGADNQVVGQSSENDNPDHSADWSTVHTRFSWFSVGSVGDGYTMGALYRQVSAASATGAAVVGLTGSQEWGALSLAIPPATAGGTIVPAILRSMGDV
jgi:hypothetical protein